MFDELNSLFNMNDEDSSNNIGSFEMLDNVDRSTSDRPAWSEPRTFTEGLNKEQKEAVEHLDGPLLILAGAGSGKTRVITHRIARLVEYHGVPIRNILAVTFTNKAASEMRERVEKLLGTSTRQLFIGTFHSLMSRILRMHAEAIGFNQHFLIVDRDGQLKVIDEILKNNKFQTDLGTAKDIINFISSMKSKLVTAEELQSNYQSNIKYLELANVYAMYQAELSKLNSMDFDDILVFAVKLFETRTDILKIYMNRFQYIMVDEYQDTNHVQYRIIELLSGAHHNICVVGDDDQSIYSFRGADMENILSFEHSFPNCKVIKLEQNYRSSQNILTAANHLISKNKKRKAKALWTDAGDGELIEYRQCADQYGEGDFIAREIDKLKSSGVKYSDISILYRNNALTRHVEKALTQRGIPFAIYGGLRFLDRKEIKDLLAYLNLIVDPQNNISFNRVINIPRRGIGQKSIDEIDRIARHYGKSYLEVAYHASSFDSLSRNSAKLENFAKLILNFRKRLFSDSDNLAEFVSLVQEKTGLIDWYLDEKNSKSIEESNNRIENLREFLSDTLEFIENASEEILPSFTDEELEFIQDEGEKQRLYKQKEFINSINNDLASADGKAKEDSKETKDNLKGLKTSKNFILLCSYLEHASLATSNDKDKPEIEKVSLSTVHSAKGLEYEYVFLIGFEEEIFPSAQSLNIENGIEEERRLAYVAITRAKKKLYICSTEQRLLYGRTSHCMVSRFLSEIPDEVVNYTGTKVFRFNDKKDIFSKSPFDTDFSTSYGTSYFSSSRGDLSYKKKEADAYLLSKSKSLDSGNLEKELKRAISTGKAIHKIDDSAINYISTKDVVKGLKVRHARYGVGEIIDSDKVANDIVVTVKFSVGAKRLVLKNAKLQKA